MPHKKAASPEPSWGDGKRPGLASGDLSLACIYHDALDDFGIGPFSS